MKLSLLGLVAMATKEGSENNMEFFFTLDATPELQNTHTIFGKVTGETIYNMLKLAESPTDANERPLYPHKINKVKILHNPFEDLHPRIDHLKSSKSEGEDKKKQKREGVKNFKLISFGDEAEQDEQEVESFPKEKNVEATSSVQSSTSTSKEKEEKPKKKRSESPSATPPSKSQKPDDVAEDSDSDYETTMEKEKLAELERKRKEIQDQIKDIKKQYHKDKKDKTQKKEEEELPPAPTQEDAAIQDYLEEKEKYKKKKLPAKGASREAFTLSLLAKFKTKLNTAHETTDVAPTQEDEDDENWLAHKLDFSESQDAVLARDASKKQDDWYDIYDPRNPLNVRKRGAEKTSSGAGEPSRKK